MERPPYHDAVAQSGIMDRLQSLDPHLAGTPPLGLALATSDIDILCHAPDLDGASLLIWGALSSLDHFCIYQWREGERPLICTFSAFGWPFEIYVAPTLVEDQAGWRHFKVEERLLALGGDGLRKAVMRHREAGLKTEPAFALALGLPGDPYEAMLELADRPDADLASLIRTLR